jgi:hypothetical protein
MIKPGNRRERRAALRPRRRDATTWQPELVALPASPPLGRWAAWLSVAVGVVVAAGLAVHWYTGSESAVGRRAIEAVRGDAVYVEDGQESRFDPVRAREIIGDRPVILLLLRNRGAGGEYDGFDDYDICDDVAAAYPDTVVLFASGGYGFDSGCSRRRDVDVPQTVRTAEAGSGDLLSDQAVDETPVLRHFLALSEQQSPATGPRRISHVVAWLTVLVWLVPVVLAAILLFAGLRLAVPGARRVRARRATAATARATAESALARVAAHLLRPEGAGEAVAREYVLLVGAAATARTTAAWKAVADRAETVSRS